MHDSRPRGPLVPALFAIALLVAAPAAAQDFSDVEIEAIPVADSIWMLTGAGGNLGVSAGPDGVVLIDDQYAPLTPKIQAAIRKIRDVPIRFVLNTHWHGDHTGGNENLGKAGAVIVAHDNVRARMSVEQVMEVLGRTVPASPAAALPVVTFNDTVTFHLNGQTARGFHVAHAHTDGDTIVHFVEADVIHAGDILFNGIYPFIDTGSGGSIDGLLAAVDRILDIADDDTRIIAGHGPLATRDDVVKYRAMLQGVRDAVAKELAAGKDMDAIREADPLAPWNEAWGGGFMKPDRFLGIVASDLAGKVHAHADHGHDH